MIYPKQDMPYYEFGSGGGAKKTYRAILQQTGTNAPTAVVLENTLGGTVVWSYDNVGYYKATLVGAFTLNETWIIMGQGEGYFGMQSLVGVNSTDEIYVEVRNTAGVDANNLLYNNPIEITTYS